jgi:hypothetical protein
MFEEKRDGHTQAIKLIKPISKVTNVEIRKIALNGFYETPRFSLTETALQLAKLLGERDDAPDATSEIEAAIRNACAPFERPMQDVTDRQRIERSYIRLARYYRQMYDEKQGAHTRAPDYFIPPEYIPRGKSHDYLLHGKSPSGKDIGEHVVPCAAIRMYCTSYFAAGMSIDEVAKLIRRLLVIVHTDQNEADKFDTGGSGLKDKMPPRWDLETGCIFQRLHEKEIKFTAPDGLACSCKK